MAYFPSYLLRCLLTGFTDKLLPFGSTVTELIAVLLPLIRLLQALSTYGFLFGKALIKRYTCVLQMMCIALSVRSW